MKNIIKYLFPEKSKWFDIGMFENGGHYKLVQMRYRIDNNKKEFRQADMGFVNDYPSKPELFKNALLINLTT